MDLKMVRVQKIKPIIKRRHYASLESKGESANDKEVNRVGISLQRPTYRLRK